MAERDAPLYKWLTWRDFKETADYELIMKNCDNVCPTSWMGVYNLNTYDRRYHFVIVSSNNSLPVGMLTTVDQLLPSVTEGCVMRIGRDDDPEDINQGIHKRW